MSLTHMLTLTVGVSDPDDWDDVHALMTVKAKDLGKSYPYVNVSSSLVEDDEEEGLTHTEDTLFKVREALGEVCTDQSVIDSMINEMQNRGILFRERSQ